MAGRPLKLTPLITAKVCEAIRAGVHLDVAARYAGIGEATFHRWMARGRKASSGPLREFADAVDKAERDAEVALVVLWRKEAAKDWKAARDLLERRFRDRWSRAPMNVHVSGGVALEDVETIRKRFEGEDGGGEAQRS